MLATWTSKVAVFFKKVILQSWNLFQRLHIWNIYVYMFHTFIHVKYIYSSPKRTLWICQTPNPLNFKKNDPSRRDGRHGPGSRGPNYTELPGSWVRLSLVELIREEVWTRCWNINTHEIFTVIFFLGTHVLRVLFGWILRWSFLDTVSVHGWQSRVAQGFKVPGREVSVDVHQLDIPKHIPKSAIHLYQNKRLHHNEL